MRFKNWIGVFVKIVPPVVEGQGAQRAARAVTCIFPQYCVERDDLEVTLQESHMGIKVRGFHEHSVLDILVRSASFDDPVVGQYDEPRPALFSDSRSGDASISEKGGHPRFDPDGVTHFAQVLQRRTLSIRSGVIRLYMSQKTFTYSFYLIQSPPKIITKQLKPLFNQFRQIT